MITGYDDKHAHEQKATKASRPAGPGDLATEDERAAYGLLPERTLPPATHEVRGIAHRFEAIGVAATQPWLAAGLAALGELT